MTSGERMYVKENLRANIAQKKQAEKKERAKAAHFHAC